MSDILAPSPLPGDDADGAWEWGVDQEWLEAEALRSWAADEAALCDGPGSALPQSFDDAACADEDLLAMRGRVSAARRRHRRAGRRLPC